MKPAAKAMEYTLQRKIGSRKATCSTYNEEMPHKMDDQGNLELVKTKVAVKFIELFIAGFDLNVSVKGLCQQIMSEEDMNNDQHY